jgi:hypothetical protein
VVSKQIWETCTDGFGAIFGEGVGGFGADFRCIQSEILERILGKFWWFRSETWKSHPMDLR